VVKKKKTDLGVGGGMKSPFAWENRQNIGKFGRKKKESANKLVWRERGGADWKQNPNESVGGDVGGGEAPKKQVVQTYWVQWSRQAAKGKWGENPASQLEINHVGLRKKKETTRRRAASDNFTFGGG